MTQRNSFNFKLDGVAGLLFLILFVVGIYFLIQGIYTLLYYASPVLLILALVFDHKSVVNYGKWILRMLQNNVLLGAGIIVLNILAFPFVTAFLFAKALFKKKIRDAQQGAEAARATEFIDYEEVKSETLELPPIKKQKQKEENKGDYEQLFD